MSKATATTKALTDAVITVLSFARARLELRGARRGAWIRCFGRLHLSDPAGIEVGHRAVFHGGPVPTELRCARGAQLVIGSRTVLNDGVSIVARRGVRIGARCMLASGVRVRDDDGRHAAPVTIGDDVWLGRGAVVDPGSVIGDRSVVAPMAVISGTVPPRSFATGSPARFFPLGPSRTELREQLESPHVSASAAEVKDAIIEWLDDTRHFGAAAGLIPGDSAPLVAAGLLDSLGLLSLTRMLEVRFGVPIDPATGAQSIDAFVKLISSGDRLASLPDQRVSFAEEPRAKSPLRRTEAVRAPRSQMSQFARFVTERTGRRFDDYGSLHAFSVGDHERFWALFLEWSGALVTGAREPVCVGSGIQGTRFFPGVRVSWAENLLAERSPEEEQALAIVGCDETGARAEVTRAELRRRVRAIAAGLEARGLREGDRVVAIARNTIETIAACLAVTSLGATWSSIAPDMGLDAALARFRALEPKMLLAHGSTRAHGARLRVPLHDVASALPSLEAIISLDAGGGAERPRPTVLEPIALDRIEEEGRSLPGAEASAPWRRFPFDHPLFILFSSGTTGAPKCIVHSHGGALLEHLKEHRLHCDLRSGDRLCFLSTAGWMMWNWTVSALATGARVVTYDGSVSYPRRDSFLDVVEREGVTVLGLSPAYLQYLEDARVTDAPARLRSLRSILSTGSVLGARLQRWAKRNLADVPLESISGGTDILGCFVMGSPWTDNCEGESSCVGLGFDVRAWREGDASRSGTGELVCARPFPSRPIGFFGDPDGSRIHAAYYAQHEGFWTHGDLVEMTERGTVRVLGRCDGVLNIRGIRIGPSEIYDVVSSAIPEVAHALAVDADAPSEPGGKRLVLYVVLRPGHTLDRGMTLRIKKALKERATPAHVPAAVVSVGELPMTFSGKIAETAMQDALNGRPVRNLAALRNPAAIERAIAALHEVEGTPLCSG